MTLENGHSAIDWQETVDRMIGVTSRLTDIIDQETRALSEHQTDQIIGLQDEKAQLAYRYEMDLRAIAIVNSDTTDHVREEDVARLKNSIGQLRDRLDENAKALSAVKSVSEGLIRALSEAATEHKAPTTGYNCNADMSRGKNTAPAALSLDEHV